MLKERQVDLLNGQMPKNSLSVLRLNILNVLKMLLSTAEKEGFQVDVKFEVF